jgi:galactokinase
MSNTKHVVASAPGRLDVMGGIADYSGSLVLQMALTQHTHVTLTLRDDYRCRIESHLPNGDVMRADVDYYDYLEEGEVDYAFACDQFNQHPHSKWTAYVLGCALVLQKEKGIRFRGADLTIDSSVPLGKGVSSSASIEVAVMKALAEAFHVSFSGTQLAVLAQRVENRVVGAPCGLMDQLSACFGEPGKLLPIVCQPDKIEALVPVPEDVFFVGVDSGVKHSVGSSAYADARCAAFMGYSIIAKSVGVARLTLRQLRHRKFDRSILPYQGYLANITVQEFEAHFRHLLPEKIRGSVFQSRYGDIIDRVTEVEPSVEYDVLACTQHAVYENYRVQRFRERLGMLQPGMDPQTRLKILHDMGTCMYQSHESYSRCGLGDAKTDEIVRLVSGKPGIFGARITGGGQGGTVCVFGTTEGMNSVREVCNELGVGLIGD